VVAEPDAAGRPRHRRAKRDGGKLQTGHAPRVSQRGKLRRPPCDTARKRRAEPAN
jgi:hypothetical protein